MDEKLNHSLLYEMLRIRLVEEKIAELYPEQEMRCPIHLCIGEEAIAAGVCANLKDKDIVMSNHRSHGHYLAKGGNLKALIAELYGKSTGCSKGRGGSMHLIDLSVNFLGSTAIVGGTIPVAVGTAFGSKLQGKDDTVTVVFFGDGTVEEGVVHESLNFASLKNLPILFICQNDFYSVYTHISDRQPPRQIYLLAKAHGMKSYQADGNNVTEVYEVTKKAIGSINKGEGPVFIEFLTYRWLEHCGPYYDNDLGYRTETEFNDWVARCPFAYFTSKILKDGVITNDQLELMKKKIRNEINEAVSFAKSSQFPDKSTLFENVYSN